MLALTRQLEWSQVFNRAQALAEKHADAAAHVKEAIQDLPRDHFVDLWRDDNGSFYVNMLPGLAYPEKRAWINALQPLTEPAGAEPIFGTPQTGKEYGGIRVKLAFGPERRSLYQIKRAYSEALSGLAIGTGFKRFPGSDKIPGFPGPIAGTLAGGLLGAGLGYGAGWLGEKLMPDTWQKGRLRRTLAIAGGLGGTLPGLGWMGTNVLTNRPFYSTELANTGQLPVNRKTSSCEVYIPRRMEKEALYGKPGGYPGFAQGGSTGAMPIALDDLSNTIYRDPRVSNRLTPQEQVGTTALFESAYAARGGGPRIVTPVDVAKITAGMGTGYLSGMLVGKALGALTGMPQPAQDRLKTTGLWAGVVANLVPLAFGR